MKKQGAVISCLNKIVSVAWFVAVQNPYRLSNYFNNNNSTVTNMCSCQSDPAGLSGLVHEKSTLACLILSSLPLKALTLGASTISWSRDPNCSRVIPPCVTRRTSYSPLIRIPTLLLTKNPGLSRTAWEIYHDLFGAHECLNIKKKTFIYKKFRV